MNRQQIIDRFMANGIIPVIAGCDSEQTISHVMDALVKGGLPLLEITFRMDHAETYIRTIRREFPDVLVGAGTVLSVEQADLAIEAGALFIVTPGLNHQVVQHCNESGIPVFPGVATASEIEQALELGCDVVKFFPAEQLGGVKTIKALSGPYKRVKFIPTGGVGFDEMNDYLAAQPVLAIGGTFMFQNLIQKQDWPGITSLTKKAVQMMLDLRLEKLLLNTSDKETTWQTAQTMSEAFQLDMNQPQEDALTMGSFLQLQAGPASQEAGQLILSTPNLMRTMVYLTSRGVSFVESADDAGLKQLSQAIECTGRISGYSIKIVQR